MVFSTYVEVIPASAINLAITPSFLHVCGGDPKRVADREEKIMFSPRMWRWSYIADKQLNLGNVFSTYVEVILTSKTLAY